MARLQPRTACQRGVSLVEALVALAVMSIGMLALVGVQSTMRLNSDLAKQRTEATRIASEEVELVRSFTSMDVVNGQPGVSYDEIVSRVIERYQAPDGIGNTSYRVVRNVTDLPGSAQKAVSVQVQWVDRTNQPQTVTLDSAISGAAPTLGAILIVPHRESATSQRSGRGVSIPLDAEPFGSDGFRFLPIGSGSAVAWYFKNDSDQMWTCPEMDDTCRATLVSGIVRYQLSQGGLNVELDRGAVAMRIDELCSSIGLPNGCRGSPSSACYAGSAETDREGLRFQRYYCAVGAPLSGWGGMLFPRLLSAGEQITANGNPLRSCRYTTDRPVVADPYAEFTVNADHPRVYCMEKPLSETARYPCTGTRVRSNLINQNFLVTDSGSCPAAQAAFQHQPWPPS